MSKVSIVVPTYRRDKTLINSLRSLAMQTYEDIEVVLVDDNADVTWNGRVSAILKELKESYPSLNIVHITNENNMRSAETRNIGIAAATGEYITFLDDDDMYLPEKVSRQVSFMKKGDYDYSITDLYLYNQNDKLIDRRIRHYIKSESCENLFRYHLMYHLTGTDTMMFKKTYLNAIGGFAPIDVGDEFYLMQRAIDGGGKFGYLPGCDVKAYVHIGDSGLSSGAGKIAGENELYEHKKSFFEKLDKKARKYIEMRHFAVLAFADVRNKKLFAFVRDMFRSFFSAPILCVKMFFFER